MCNTSRFSFIQNLVPINLIVTFLCIANHLNFLKSQDNNQFQADMFYANYDNNKVKTCRKFGMYTSDLNVPSWKANYIRVLDFLLPFELNLFHFALLVLCQDNSPVTGKCSSQRASNAVSVSKSWHHHGQWLLPQGFLGSAKQVTEVGVLISCRHVT